MNTYQRRSEEEILQIQCDKAAKAEVSRFAITIMDVSIVILILLGLTFNAKFECNKTTQDYSIYSWEEAKQRLPGKLIGGLSIIVFLYGLRVVNPKLFGRNVRYPSYLVCRKCLRVKRNDNNVFCKCGGAYEDADYYTFR